MADINKLHDIWTAQKELAAVSSDAIVTDVTSYQQDNRTWYQVYIKKQDGSTTFGVGTGIRAAARRATKSVAC